MNIAGKIAVMQAFADGKAIEYRNEFSSIWHPSPTPLWDWSNRTYRVAPPKPVKVTKFAVVDRDGDVTGTFDDIESAERLSARMGLNGHYKPYTVGELTYESRA